MKEVANNMVSEIPILRDINLVELLQQLELQKTMFREALDARFVSCGKLIPVVERTPCNNEIVVVMEEGVSASTLLDATTTSPLPPPVEMDEHNAFPPPSCTQELATKPLIVDGTDNPNLIDDYTTKELAPGTASLPDDRASLILD